jgi:putative transposase
MEKKDQTRKKYPSDLTDAQWAIVAPLLPPAKQSARGGHPRTVDMREVLNTIFYLNRSGGQGAIRPHDVLPTSTVYDSLAPWRDDGTWAQLVQALRDRTRVAAGRKPTPSAACIESPTVKTTERGGPERGDDGGKNIKGRKRHLWVATLGLLLAVLLTRAGLDAGVAAPLLLRHVTPQDLPRLVPIFADQKDHHHALDAWMATPRTGWRSEVQARPEGIQGFTPLEKRGVIERTHAWHGRYQRHSKDDERSVESSTAMLQVSNIHLRLNRLAPCDRPVFHYRRDAA